MNKRDLVTLAFRDFNVNRLRNILSVLALAVVYALVINLFCFLIHIPSLLLKSVTQYESRTVSFQTDKMIAYDRIEQFSKTPHLDFMDVYFYDGKKYVYSTELIPNAAFINNVEKPEITECYLQPYYMGMEARLQGRLVTGSVNALQDEEQMNGAYPIWLNEFLMKNMNCELEDTVSYYVFNREHTAYREFQFTVKGVVNYNIPNEYDVDNLALIGILATKEILSFYNGNDINQYFVYGYTQGEYLQQAIQTLRTQGFSIYSQTEHIINQSYEVVTVIELLLIILLALFISVGIILLYNNNKMNFERNKSNYALNQALGMSKKNIYQTILFENFILAALICLGALCLSFIINNIVIYLIEHILLQSALIMRIEWWMPFAVFGLVFAFSYVIVQISFNKKSNKIIESLRER